MFALGNGGENKRWTCLHQQPLTTAKVPVFLWERIRFARFVPKRTIMDEVQSTYRGYSIHIERSWSGRFLTISPVSPELPILGRNSRFLFDTSNEEAIGEAQIKIDAILNK